MEMLFQNITLFTCTPYLQDNATVVSLHCCAYFILGCEIPVSKHVIYFLSECV